MEKKITPDDAAWVERIVSHIFRTTFEEHPLRDEDPGTALADALEDAAECIPEGIEGDFDYEALDFTVTNHELYQVHQAACKKYNAPPRIEDWKEATSSDTRQAVLEYETEYEAQPLIADDEEDLYEANRRANKGESVWWAWDEDGLFVVFEEDVY